MAVFDLQVPKDINTVNIYYYTLLYLSFKYLFDKQFFVMSYLSKPCLSFQELGYKVQRILGGGLAIRIWV